MKEGSLVIVVVAFAVCFGGCNSVSAILGGAESPDTTLRSRLLLLDSRIIEETENAQLVLGKVRKDKHNPLFGEDKPWEPRFDNVYANVIYDEEDRLYKCWYSPFIIDERTTSTPEDERNPDDHDYMDVEPTEREMGVCYAVSKDGIHWEKPELGLVEFDGDRKNNILMRGNYFRGVFTGPHGAGVFKDLRELDPAKRYKMFFKGTRMSVSFSPDGLRWSEAIRCRQLRARGDTHNNAFWDPYGQRYMGYTRLWRDRQRVVGFTQSTDFENWTKSYEVLRDYDDDPGNPGGEAQTHDMVVFPTGGVYIGLLGMMYFPRNESNYHVKQHVELAWSPDGEEWHRIQEGTPFIRHTPAEKEEYGKMPYDWGTIFASTPVFLEDEIRIYYGACDWYFFDWRKGFLALATLRPDGWAGYEPIAADQPASVTTTAVVHHKRALRICADVEDDGYVIVRLLDKRGRQLAESEPVKRGVTDGRIEWENGFSMGDLGSKVVRLSFEFKTAAVYSLSFGD